MGHKLTLTPHQAWLLAVAFDRAEGSSDEELMDLLKEASLMESDEDRAFFSVLENGD